MPSKRTLVLNFVGVAVLALFVPITAGCTQRGDLSIPPLPAAEGRINPGLGPDARPLSSGPGYKGSPSWAPGGERVAFLMDGYVVDRAVDGDEVTRWTTRDFVAEEAEWADDGTMTVLGGADEAAGKSDGRPKSLFRATGEGSLGVEKITSGILAMSSGPKEDQVLLATRVGPGESRIALLQDGRMERIYMGTVGGKVTGLFPSPDGERIALAVRPEGSRLANELHVFDLREGEDREVASFEERGILGAPQWTDRGIYFVAGSDTPVEGNGTLAYDLYRASPEPGDPEPAPGVGEDFVAGSVRVSPDGGRLAVVGRLNPKSPVNLYVLELASKDFAAVTTNEDMEIKTGPDDIAWSPAGESVAIVARGASTGDPEVRAAPADDLLDDFYNLYEIPVPNPAPPEATR